MISFRLSPEEYAHFRELCLTQGIRSFSEMARAAVNKLAQDTDTAYTTSGAFESRIRNLEGKVQVLAHELRRLQHPNGKADGEPVSYAPEGVVSQTSD